MPSARAAPFGQVVALVHRETGRVTLDVVEQQRRAIGQSGGNLGDAPDLEFGIRAGDVPKRLQVRDLLDELAQVLVAHVWSAVLVKSTIVDPVRPGRFIASALPTINESRAHATAGAVLP
jgi:hypothetical protein